MVDSLTPGVFHRGANPEAFEAQEIKDGKAVDTDDWTEVARKVGDKNNAYGAGYGPQNRDQNTQGRSDFDLQLHDSADTAHPAQGHFRFAVYGDTYAEDLLATSGTIRASVLRGAVAADPSEKEVIAAMYDEMAGDASMIRLEYQAAENNTSSGESEDGYTLHKAGSTIDRGIAVGRLPL
jgi:hypothetical protein